MQPVTSRIADLDKLVPEFREIVLKIIEDITSQNLPLYVFETLRTKERQQYLFSQGTTKTLKGKHLEGKAVDFVVKDNGKWTWDNKHVATYKKLGEIVSKYDNIRWGGDFKKFKDYPHIEYTA